MEPLELLVRAAQQGDADAFDGIVERFQDMAYASAYAMVEDVQMAEDVAQEAFIEAYLNLPKLREAAAFPGWFRRIIFKQGDRLTRGKRLAISAIGSCGGCANGWIAAQCEIAEANEASEQVRRAIAALPAGERMVIMLFYGTGYELKDIAAFLGDLKRFANAKGITAILFGTVGEADQPVDRSLVGELDGLIKLSQARARQSLWPAVDPLASHSRLLESDAVSAEHRQVAQQAQGLLQHCEEQRAKARGDALSSVDQRVLARGERLNLFFSQPLTVAEAYTDLPGAYLSIEETVSSFRDLLDGRYDDMPAEAFYFVGTIERARS